MIRFAPLLLIALCGCSLFFHRGPYGRIPDVGALDHQQKPALLAAKADSCLESGENSAGLITPIGIAAFARLTPGQQRRYARALRAANTAPRKVKATGRATAQAGVGNKSTSTSGNKSATATDSAQVINAPKADNVAGPGATQTNIESSILSWRLLLLLLAAAAAGIAAGRLTA